jgi:hypothetical protein
MNGPCHGLALYRTMNGVAFIDLDIEADPEFRNHPEKIQELRNRFTSEAHFQREVKRKAYSLSGATVYPEFDPKIHVVPRESIPKRGCLYMALDPHPRTPHAALWVLIDAWSDWWVYRELWPSIISGRKGRLRDEDQDNQYSIREYVQTIAELLEGNEIEWRHAETDREYGVYRMKGGERIINRFMDQAGKGFIASEVENETYSTRYNRYGLDFSDPRKDHDAGEDAVRTLLQPRKHDTKGIWPRLHISEDCPELILELRQHRYKIMKRLSEERELKQDRSEFRCHLVDTLRYLATSDASYLPRLVSERHNWSHTQAAA